MSEHERYVVGLDLGQAADYTAAIVVQALEVAGEPACHVRYIRRYPLKTSYPAIVEDVGTLMARPPLRHAGELVVDATGCGRPVVDELRRAGLAPLPVTITAGVSELRDDDGGYRVPKRDLVSRLQVLLQSGRLKSARLPEWPLLEAELLTFTVKVAADTGNDSYGAWREGQHDDLVLALALACWRACVPRPFVIVSDEPVGFDMRPKWSSWVPK